MGLRRLIRGVLFCAMFAVEMLNDLRKHYTNEEPHAFLARYAIIGEVAELKL